MADAAFVVQYAFPLSSAEVCSRVNDPSCRVHMSHADYHVFVYEYTPDSSRRLRLVECEVKVEGEDAIRIEFIRPYERRVSFWLDLFHETLSTDAITLYMSSLIPAPNDWKNRVYPEMLSLDMVDMDILSYPTKEQMPKIFKFNMKGFYGISAQIDTTWCNLTFNPDMNSDLVVGLNSVYTAISEMQERFRFKYVRTWILSEISVEKHLAFYRKIHSAQSLDLSIRMNRLPPELTALFCTRFPFVTELVLRSVPSIADQLLPTAFPALERLTVTTPQYQSAIEALYRRPSWTPPVHLRLLYGIASERFPSEYPSLLRRNISRVILEHVPPYRTAKEEVQQIQRCIVWMICVVAKKQNKLNLTMDMIRTCTDFLLL